MLEELGPNRLPAMIGSRPANVGCENHGFEKSVARTQL